MYEFVKRHRATLDAVPTGFFSEAAEHVENMTRATGWRPGHVALIAGAAKLAQDGGFLRWLTRQRDHARTNWDAVGAFACEMAAAASARDPVVQCLA